MLDKDGTEDFILDLVDEVVDSTMDTIYKTYIDKQLLPFTISQAKDAILQIIDVSFISCLKIIVVTVQKIMEMYHYN